MTKNVLKKRVKEIRQVWKEQLSKHIMATMDIRGDILLIDSALSNLENQDDEQLGVLISKVRRLRDDVEQLIPNVYSCINGQLSDLEQYRLMRQTLFAN